MEDVDHRTAGTVLLGALVLIGIPTFAVSSSAFETFWGFVGVTHWTAGLLSFGASVVIALWAAGAAAEVQLHGIEALWRGNRRSVVVRHGVATTFVVLGLGIAGATAVQVSWWVVSGQYYSSSALVMILAGLLFVSVIVVGVRFGKGLLEGYRTSGA